ncbi:MAG: thioredoxin family protein [Synergistaceae bacterium]|jgi:thioredoxin 1|nr:thioredoxin family protein [Synergistaceae bacterium]
MPVLKITEDNFDEITSRGALLLDFGAEYCAPCKALGRVMERISNEFPDLTAGSADVDVSPALAARFGIMSIPAVVALRSGKTVGKITGAKTREDILPLISLVLSKEASR